MLRIEASLLKQVLVVNQHRSLGVEGQRIEAIRIGREAHVRRAERVIERQRGGKLTDLGQLPSRGELRHINQVDSQQVRRLASGDRGAEFRNVFSRRDQRDFDLVVVRGVKLFGESLNEGRRAVTRPERDSNGFLR